MRTSPKQVIVFYLDRLIFSNMGVYAVAMRFSLISYR